MIFSCKNAVYLVFLQLGTVCVVSIVLPQFRDVYLTPTLYSSRNCVFFNDILSPFVNVANDSTRGTYVKNEHDSKHIASFISTLDIVNKVKELLLEHGYVKSVVDIKRQSRLEYNEDTIKETYTSAILTHNSFDTERPIKPPDSCFSRFDGDHEDELSLTNLQLLPANEVIASIPSDFCHSLAASTSELFQSLGLLKLEHSDSSFLSRHTLHIDNLLKLSFGTYFNWNTFQSIDKGDYNATFPGETSKNDTFEKKLFDFISIKRLQLLRVLILFDTLLSIDSSISDVLNNSYIRLISINDDEKEILLLGLALVGDYFINLLDFILRYLHNKASWDSRVTVKDQIKTLWLHYLINKDVSHLPTLMSDTSIEQIQQNIIKYRASRRKMATLDMFNLAMDPILTIQDHIEHIAQYHYRREDTFPRKFGYGPLLSNRKIHIEELLCKIESELLSFQENEIEYSPFTVSSKDFYFVLNGNKVMDDITVGSQNKCTDFSIILSLFSDHIMGRSHLPNLSINLNQLLTGLNSLVTPSLLNRFISTLISHKIRLEQEKPKEHETNFQKRFRGSYLSDCSRGISCRLILPSTPGKVAEFLSNETDNSLREQAFIVPFVDLCNHSSTNANSRISATHAYSEKAYSKFNDLIFQLSTTRDIESKDEIKINYGANDNNIFLLDYGFISSETNDHGVIMDIEPAYIREAAESHNIGNMLPLAYPYGLPKEKSEVLKDLKLIKIPKSMDIMELYKYPHFEGLPITKYCEFAGKFIARENAKNDPLLYYDNNDTPDRTRHRPYISESEENTPNEELDIVDHIKITGDGVPDPRLVLLLKVSFCRTVKRLDWIKQQSIEYLSTSVNSPLDVKIFKVAATLCRNYINSNYIKTISEDLKLVHDKELCKLALKYKGFQEIKNFASISPPNAVVISHGLRQKIPIYKCANFYNKCSQQRR